jgi:hypothetical protein
MHTHHHRQNRKTNSDGKATKNEPHNKLRRDERRDLCRRSTQADRTRADRSATPPKIDTAEKTSKMQNEAAPKRETRGSRVRMTIDRRSTQTRYHSDMGGSSRFTLLCLQCCFGRPSRSDDVDGLRRRRRQNERQRPSVGPSSLSIIIFSIILFDQQEKTHCENES